MKRSPRIGISSRSSTLGKNANGCISKPNFVTASKCSTVPMHAQLVIVQVYSNTPRSITSLKRWSGTFSIRSVRYGHRHPSPPLAYPLVLGARLPPFVVLRTHGCELRHSHRDLRRAVLRLGQTRKHPHHQRRHSQAMRFRYRSRSTQRRVFVSCEQPKSEPFSSSHPR